MNTASVVAGVGIVAGVPAFFFRSYLEAGFNRLKFIVKIPLELVTAVIKFLEGDIDEAQRLLQKGIQKLSEIKAKKKPGKPGSETPINPESDLSVFFEFLKKGGLKDLIKSAESLQTVLQSEGFKKFQNGDFNQEIQMLLKFLEKGELSKLLQGAEKISKLNTLWEMDTNALATSIQTLANKTTKTAAELAELEQLKTIQTLKELTSSHNLDKISKWVKFINMDSNAITAKISTLKQTAPTPETKAELQELELLQAIKSAYGDGNLTSTIKQFSTWMQRFNWDQKTLENKINEVKQKIPKNIPTPISNDIASLQKELQELELLQAFKKLNQNGELTHSFGLLTDVLNSDVAEKLKTGDYEAATQALKLKLSQSIKKSLSTEGKEALQESARALAAYLQKHPDLKTSLGNQNNEEALNKLKDALIQQDQLALFTKHENTFALLLQLPEKLLYDYHTAMSSAATEASVKDELIKTLEQQFMEAQSKKEFDQLEKSLFLLINFLKTDEPSQLLSNIQSINNAAQYASSWIFWKK